MVYKSRAISESLSQSGQTEVSTRRLLGYKSHRDGFYILWRSNEVRKVLSLTVPLIGYKPFLEMVHDEGDNTLVGSVWGGSKRIQLTTQEKIVLKIVK